MECIIIVCFWVFCVTNEASIPQPGEKRVGIAGHCEGSRKFPQLGGMLPHFLHFGVSKQTKIIIKASFFLVKIPNYYYYQSFICSGADTKLLLLSKLHLFWCRYQIIIIIIIKASFVLVQIPNYYYYYQSFLCSGADTKLLLLLSKLPLFWCRYQIIIIIKASFVLVQIPNYYYYQSFLCSGADTKLLLLSKLPLF